MGGQDAGDGKWAQFGRDLRQAGGVLARDPLLPILTAVLMAGTVALERLGHAWAALALPPGIALLGFAGTQRVWFLQGFRNRRMDRGEIPSLTRAFIPRFFLLALVADLFLVPTLFVLQAVSGPAAFPSHAAVHSARRPWGILLAACLVADVALTFVTPALALSVRSCREALRRGFRTLGETWPSCALYALTPGIAFVAISVWVPTPGGVLGSALVAAAGGLLALWFKGAVVAFYLRLHPRVADSGAAYADEPARPPRRRA